MMNDAPRIGTEPKVTIRLATASDAIVLARLRYAFRSSTGQVDEEDESFVQRCTPWMQERLEKASLWRCWLAEHNHTTVGSLWAQLIEKVPNPTAEPEYHVYLTNLYVREDCRGHGIGSVLLSAALAWIQTNDVQAVILWPSKRSRSLYLRHGFSVPEDLMELIIETGNNLSAGDEREKEIY
jgi:GNAT superfamily N-acetyltransferase